MNTKHSRSRFPFWALLLPVLFALPLGCQNPFQPATPEPPIGGSLDEVWTTPQDLLDTVELAIETRTQEGANSYLRAFAESTTVTTTQFRALYDPAVRQIWETSTHQTAPEPWGITLERNLHSYLSNLRPTAAYTFSFDPDPSIPNDESLPNGDIIAHRKYTLEATENGVKTILSSGFADLTLGLILALARKIPVADRSTKAGAGTAKAALGSNWTARLWRSAG